jgi:hypothetical protein
MAKGTKSRLTPAGKVLAIIIILGIGFYYANKAFDFTGSDSYDFKPTIEGSTNFLKSEGYTNISVNEYVVKKKKEIVIHSFSAVKDNKKVEGDLIYIEGESAPSVYLKSVRDLKKSSFRRNKNV